MPQIPRYESKASQAVLEVPNIPESMGAIAGATVEKAGERLFSEGVKWQDTFKREEDANLATQVSLLHSKLTRDMSDSRNALLASPEFNLDPQEAMKKWADDWQQKGSQYAQQFTDERAQRIFNQHYAQTFTTIYDGIGQSTQMQKANLRQASTISAIDNYVSAMSKAPSEQEFDLNRTHMISILNAAVVSGVIKPTGAQKILDLRTRQAARNNLMNQIAINPQGVLDSLDSGQGLSRYIDDPHVVRSLAQSKIDSFNTDRDRVAKEEQKNAINQANNNALDYLTRLYGLGGGNADYESAYRDAMDPDKAKGLGLNDLEQRTTVANVISSQANQIRNLQAQKQKDIDSKGSEQVTSGNWGADQVQASDMSDSAKRNALRWINTQERWQNHTDIDVWKDVDSKIQSGEINDPSQLLDYAGKGLGKGDIGHFTAIINTRNDPSKSKWFTLATQNYDKRYAYEFFDPKEASDHRMAFVTGLSQAIQDGSLKGPAILEQANKMFQEQDKALGITTKGSSVVGGKVPVSGKAETIPNPVSSPNKQPEAVGTHKTTGAPVYKMPDGSYSMKPADMSSKPELIGVSKSTGKAVYRMPDGSYLSLDDPSQGTIEDQADNDDGTEDIPEYPQ